MTDSKTQKDDDKNLFFLLLVIKSFQMQCHVQSSHLDDDNLPKRPSWMDGWDERGKLARSFLLLLLLVIL